MPESADPDAPLSQTGRPAGPAYPSRSAGGRQAALRPAQPNSEPAVGEPFRHGSCYSCMPKAMIGRSNGRGKMVSRSGASSGVGRRVRSDRSSRPKVNAEKPRRCLVCGATPTPRAKRRADGTGRAEPNRRHCWKRQISSGRGREIWKRRCAVRPWSLQSGNKALAPPVTPCRARRRSHTTTQAATPGYSQLATGTLLP